MKPGDVLVSANSGKPLGVIDEITTEGVKIRGLRDGIVLPNWAQWFPLKYITDWYEAQPAAKWVDTETE